MDDFNVEYRENGEWYAQHTQVRGIREAVRKARALWHWKVDQGHRFASIRVTKGPPFTGEEVRTYLGPRL